MPTVHLELSDEAYSLLVKKKRKGRYRNYSLVVDDLLFNDSNNKNLEDRLDKMNNYNVLTFDLLKQFYSDMGIVGLSDPNKCKNLQKFFLKRRGLNND